jgi:hypothetical protein
MTYFDGERFIVKAEDKYVIYNWYHKYSIDQIIDWSETRVVNGYKLITVIFTATIIR